MITVLYDGACPQCVKDRHLYEKLCDVDAKGVEWLDITGQEQYLKNKGIDPIDAMLSLHVINHNGQVINSIDAYSLLFHQIWYCRPISWLINLPFIKPKIENYYREKVNRRLRNAGRI